MSVRGASFTPFLHGYVLYLTWDYPAATPPTRREALICRPTFRESRGGLGV